MGKARAATKLWDKCTKDEKNEYLNSWMKAPKPEFVGDTGVGQIRRLVENEDFSALYFGGGAFVLAMSAAMAYVLRHFAKKQRKVAGSSDRAIVPETRVT